MIGITSYINYIVNILTIKEVKYILCSKELFITDLILKRR